MGNVRSSGLMGAAELVADKATRRPFDPKRVVGPTCAAFLQEEGVVTRAMGDALALCPPLVISEDETNEMFDLVEKALDRTEAWVSREGLRAA